MAPKISNTDSDYTFTLKELNKKIPTGDGTDPSKAISKSSNFSSNLGKYAGIASGIMGAADSFLGTYNQGGPLDAYSAIYGNSSDDPLGRLLLDVQGKYTKNAISNLDRNANLQVAAMNANTGSWDAINLNLANLKLDNTFSKSKNNMFNSIGSFFLGVPYLQYGDNGKIEFSTDNLSAAGLGAIHGTNIGGLGWGTLIGAGIGGVSNLFSRGMQNKRIGLMNEAIRYNNDFKTRNAQSQSLNMAKSELSNDLRNFKAFGGAIDYEIANRGLNNYEARTNSASKYLGYIPPITFASGGAIPPMNSEANGIVSFNEGGTHELNILGGIPQGIAPDGKPNLVEEGEKKYKDYIYSDRSEVDNANTLKYKLPKGTTYAKAVDKLGKESEERPYDPISQNFVEVFTSDLKLGQEELNKEKEMTLHRFDCGGHKYYNGDNLLRYAPVAASTLGAVQSAFQKPDYSTMDSAELYLLGLPGVTYTPIGNYVAAPKFDRNYYMNQANAQHAAALDALLNNSGGNRGAALAGTVALDFNSGLQNAALARQALEAQWLADMQAAAFNNDINKFNSTAGLQTSQANRLFGLQTASLLAALGQLRNAEKLRVQNELAQSLSNLGDNLGAVGEDLANRATVKWMAENGLFGTLPKACGGKKKTKKKGLTC